MNETKPPVGECLFTIGHSNHSLEAFIGLLKRHDIKVVVDVRSHPHSRYAPHFNAQPLHLALASAGIKYVFMGNALGGRPEERKFYDETGHVLYSLVAETSLFLEGISRLEKGIQKMRVAIMCSEENPTGCHRRLLISRFIASRGVMVVHLRGDGREQTETELCRKENAGDSKRISSQMTLFSSGEITEWKSIQSVLHKSQQKNSLDL